MARILEGVTQKHGCHRKQAEKRERVHRAAVMVETMLSVKLTVVLDAAGNPAAVIVGVPAESRPAHSALFGR